MTIGQEVLRAVTWLSEASPSLTEIYLLASRKCILTVWTGDASALDEIRAQFAERVEDLEKSPYQAAAIVLQLLLGTLDQASSAIDVRLQEFREQLKQNPTTIDLTVLTDRLQRLRSAWSAIDRYSTTVRSAIVGIEALGIDQRAAAELNNYADQVDDIEHRLHERYQWGADIAQSSAAAIAKRQGEQINRLTVVSLMFLPITFLTGFFGMNFDWMINSLGSPAAFFLWESCCSQRASSSPFFGSSAAGSCKVRHPESHWCDVRYGSLADIRTSPRHVRLTPHNGRWTAHSSQHLAVGL